MHASLAPVAAPFSEPPPRRSASSLRAGRAARRDRSRSPHPAPGRRAGRHGHCATVVLILVMHCCHLRGLMRLACGTFEPMIPLPSRPS